MTGGIATSLFVLAGVLAAQTPPVASQTQSLSDTFDLIGAAVASQGPVIWEGYVHDSTPAAGDPADWTYQRRLDISDFNYDLANCGLRFHYRVTTNGVVSSESDVGFPLRDVRTIKVASEQALVLQRDAQSGHPARISQIQPEISDVDLTRRDGSEIVLSFYDAQTASQVADAFQHAAALCGVNGLGGS